MIEVKFLSKRSGTSWQRQLPDNSQTWGNCHFSFDQQTVSYDWLVVFDDTPAEKNERFSKYIETLQCPREHTLLITLEPHVIKHYGDAFTCQFAYVLTSQTETQLPHTGRIYSQPSLPWFYGISENACTSFREIADKQHVEKSDELSAVWSNKKQRHAILYQRHSFLNLLKTALPEIKLYGADHSPLDDKAEALDPYKYHIAIENHVGKHHWTEKIADSFLGRALPFYYGCPNLIDYFPEQSFIRIDIFKPENALTTIKKAIANNEYEKRIESIEQARNKVLYEYNMFAVISRIIESHHDYANKAVAIDILSRRAANRKSLPGFFRHQFQKYYFRYKYALLNYIK